MGKRRAAVGAAALSASLLLPRHVPLLRPAIGAAAAVAFVFAFHELTMSSLLYGPAARRWRS